MSSYLTKKLDVTARIKDNEIEAISGISAMKRGLARKVKLCESADFRDAILAAKEHFANFGLTEAFIEKDYYVTEALRIVATQWPTQVIFKGGTSLSKGWKLIERFSEDIDLFLNKDAFTPRLGESLAERELKAIE